ncbi:hypothetical protein [Comamonas sediminis]|uniref:Uncharacterized protein n=1 Tax=Comamonas sediminis TaxID=1783360 RepID=A0ABV4B0K7_9BURK
MKLLTMLPARKDGTLNVVLNDGAAYKFKGEPLACEVENEDHVDELKVLGFMDEDEFDIEQKFKKQRAERQARLSARTEKAATGAPAVTCDNEDDDFTTGTGLPQEEQSKPSGRVRRAPK